MKEILLTTSLFLSSLLHAHIDSTMNSHINIVASCAITTYYSTRWASMTGTFPTDIFNSTGYISTLCTKNSSYKLGLDNGKQYDAVSGMRRLNNRRGSYIKYNIFSNSAHTIPWGNVGTPNALSLTGTGSTDTHILYAKIPAGQPPVQAGFYQDMVAVTLDF